MHARSHTRDDISVCPVCARDSSSKSGERAAGVSAGLHRPFPAGRAINGDGSGSLDSRRLHVPALPPVPGAPTRRRRRAARHLPLTAAGARQPRTARQPGARSSRPAAPRRPGRRRAGAATGPPWRTCTARPPCARRTPASPVRPAPRRPWSFCPAPARPRPARPAASRQALRARRTGGAAARVAPSRRTRLRNLSCPACGLYKHVSCPTDSTRPIGAGARWPCVSVCRARRTRRARRGRRPGVALSTGSAAPSAPNEDSTDGRLLPPHPLR